MHMCVDAYSRHLVPCYAHDDVGHLRPDAGEVAEPLSSPGDVAPKLYADISGLLDVFGLVVVETDAVYEALGSDERSGLEVSSLLWRHSQAFTLRVSGLIEAIFGTVSPPGCACILRMACPTMASLVWDDNIRATRVW